jgi:hypothetical protein
MSYQDTQTGVWNGLPSVRTVTETINVKLSDVDGDTHPAIVEIDVNDFEVTILNVFAKTAKELSDPMYEIRDELRKFYRTQEIKTC